VLFHSASSAGEDTRWICALPVFSFAAAKEAVDIAPTMSDAPTNATTVRNPDISHLLGSFSVMSKATIIVLPLHHLTPSMSSVIDEDQGTIPQYGQNLIA
jgi:hypothetical protein